MEIFKELPTVDIILAPAGGGGLSCINTGKMLNPNISYRSGTRQRTRMKASLKAGHVVTLPGGYYCRLAAKDTGDVIFPYTKKQMIL